MKSTSQYSPEHVAGVRGALKVRRTERFHISAFINRGEKYASVQTPGWGDVFVVEEIDVLNHHGPPDFTGKVTLIIGARLVEEIEIRADGKSVRLSEPRTVETLQSFGLQLAEPAKIEFFVELIGTLIHQ